MATADSGSSSPSLFTEFYAAQHLLKEALESGRWWPQEFEPFPLPNDQDLWEVTLLVPIPVGRLHRGGATS